MDLLVEELIQEETINADRFEVLAGLNPKTTSIL